MIHKMSIPGCDLVRVTFELPSCIWADRIHVVGDFNEWSRTTTPMKQGRDGVWRATVELTPSRRFQFRYLIDGQWQTDWHADGSVNNAFGSDNSVVDTGILNLRALDLPPASLVHEAQVTLPQRKALPVAA
ncbi:MAG: isoamylase early set domain-containing protein [Caldilineaceae bacterium]